MNSFFVFDTNVLLSAVFNLKSDSAKALITARETGYILTSDAIITEYLSVFARPKFDKWISIETRFLFIENIIENSIKIPILKEIKACRDSKDDMYLSLAIAAQANYIISGDKDLLALNPFENIPILNPSAFLKVYS